MKHEEYLDIAKQAIGKLPAETVFEVKELFKGTTWNALSRGDRISFGRYFANAVKERKVPNVEQLERGKDNHSRYKIL